jgi:hypothetical protein
MKMKNAKKNGPGEENLRRQYKSVQGKGLVTLQKRVPGPVFVIVIHYLRAEAVQEPVTADRRV